MFEQIKFWKKETHRPKKPMADEPVYEAARLRADLESQKYRLHPMDDDSLQQAIRKIQEIDRELEANKGFLQKHGNTLLSIGILVIFGVMLWLVGGNLERTADTLSSASTTVADSCKAIVNQAANAASQAQRI